MKSEELEEVIEKVESPFLSTSTKISDNVFNFSLNGKKNKWEISLVFNADFPFSLPSAKLNQPSFIGSIPHVNIAGTICIEENDSIIIDYNRPVDVVVFLIEEITKLLDRSSLKIYQDELTDEYEGYFQCQASSINSFYKPGDDLEEIYLKISCPKDNKARLSEPSLIYGKHDGLPVGFSNLNGTGISQIFKILHIPLSKSVFPPSNGEQVTSQYIYHLLKFVSNKNSVKLTRVIRKDRNRRQVFILFSIPRTTGERSQILIRMSIKESSISPLISKSTEWAVKTYLVSRNNKTYLLERGGAENSLSNKKVAIVGCGSVGSEVVAMVAKSGVGELTLVDHDTLDSDNIYRHRCGGLGLNFIPENKAATVLKRYKVNSLSSIISSDLPYIKINCKPCSFDAVLEDSDFVNSDVVVVAVGSPSLNIKINRALKSIGLNKVVFCWNEAASIGGHSVALDLDESCYECLYSEGDDFSTKCELNFLEIGQDVSKNLTGCAGVFTPFSYIDSSQTASLASTQCIEMLSGVVDSKALSWKGKNHSNLMVTERYHKISLKEEKKIVRNSACRVCMTDEWLIENEIVGNVRVSGNVVKKLCEYIQNNDSDHESGGVLIGKHLNSGGALLIDEFTPPQISDKQGRCLYYRSTAHNSIVQQIWLDSNQHSTYVGLWHTHPEPIPNFSSTDKEDWLNALNRSKYEGRNLFFIIVGQTHIRIWIGTKKFYRNSIELIGEFKIGK